MSAPAQPTQRRPMQHVFEETNRRAGPSAADRERITEALRARLGVSVMPEGFVPAPGAARVDTTGGAAFGGVTSGSAAAARRSGFGRGSWLGVVVGTGVVAGAFGFALGYGLAQRDPDVPLDRTAVVSTQHALPAPATEAPPSASRGAYGVATPSIESAPLVLPEPPPRTPKKHGTVPPPRAARDESVATGDSARLRLSFAEVLGRLQRANLALRQEQAPLALIQLAELDRGGGDILREERDVTRVLALCAIGDEAGARRVAAPLLDGAVSTIYAQRLDASCARAREP